MFAVGLDNIHRMAFRGGKMAPTDQSRAAGRGRHPCKSVNKASVRPASTLHSEG
jgi:hypothetical protein